MDHAQWKNFAKPDEVREFPKGRIELITIAEPASGGRLRARLALGEFRAAHRENQELRSPALPVSRVGRAADQDGRRNRFDCKPGDVSLLPSGHDAWVVGDEPAVVVDFQGWSTTRRLADRTPRAGAAQAPASFPLYAMR